MTDKKEPLKIKLKLYAFDTKVLDTTMRNIVDVVRKSGAVVKGPIMLPVKKRRWTVNKSPFIYKKSQEHFEMRLHQRLLVIVDPNQQTIEYLKDLQVPSGVQVIFKNK